MLDPWLFGGSYTSAPVAYRGRVYFARDTGIFDVLDLRAGKTLHRRRVDTTRELRRGDVLETRTTVAP